MSPSKCGGSQLCLPSIMAIFFGVLGPLYIGNNCVLWPHYLKLSTEKCVAFSDINRSKHTTLNSTGSSYISNRIAYYKSSLKCFIYFYEYFPVDR